MKIVTLLREKTQERRFALRTEPPVTAEMLAMLPGLIGNQYDRYALSIDKAGVLYVTPPLQAHHVKALEQILTAAEKQIAEQKQQAEDTREEFLESIARHAGLPLE